MKTFTHSVRVMLPAAASVVLASACGGATQAHAVTPGVASLQPRQGPQVSAPLANTPTAANVHISEEILRACNIPDADAYFAFDSSRLTAFDATPLNALATCFDKGPLAGRQMRLVGHADPRGSSDYNMTLGQSRADAVASYLERDGLRSAALTTSSRGAMDATGQDETGWAHDRRVEVLLAD